jgi:hypothetical protein
MYFVFKCELSFGGKIWVGTIDLYIYKVPFNDFIPLKQDKVRSSNIPFYTYFG